MLPRQRPWFTVDTARRPPPSIPGGGADPDGDAEENRALKWLSAAVLVMFLLLLVNVNYLQGFESGSLAAKPGNSRAFYAGLQYQRGSIKTSDGVTIAVSKLSSASDYAKFGVRYQRSYPSGPAFAPVTGYDTLYSESGLEQYENSVLSGSDSSLTVRNFIGMRTGKQRKGASVTVNSKAQTMATTSWCRRSRARTGSAP
jgi:peptidoglycan glycosyltransferase